MRRAFICLPVLVFALVGAPVSAEISDTPNWLVVGSPAGPPPRDAHAMAYDSGRGRVVLFGGADENGFNDFDDTWEWNGTAWTERTTTINPQRRYAHAMAYDAARGRVVLFGGYDFLAGHVLGDTWEWDGNVWVETTPATSPPGRFGHSLVYDSARQRIVLFGGAGESAELGDTWEWDGTSWVERTPAASPSPREYGALAYDAARGRTVLFGGFDGTAYLGDTWEWDGTDWVERVSATHPPERTWQMLAYDSARGRTVLFGGYDGAVAFADVWEWDGTAWLEKPSATSPSARVVGAMVYDGARSRTLLLGGFDGRDALADLWEWDGNGWVEKTPGTSPPHRSNHAMAYDDARGKTVVFGGYGGGPFLADTWEWDGRGWAEKTPVVSPPSRIFSAMAYDRARGKVVLFGGFGRTGPEDDTWEWDGTSWTQKAPATGPSARHSHTMAYDAARGRVVLFGGSDSVDFFADTWEWDGDNWIDVTPAMGPAARYRQTMVYDTARERVVLFGGASSVGFFGDTWEWDGTSWVERFPATSPPARYEHAMAYDSRRGRAVIFGGYDGVDVRADTWEWDGNDWTEAPVASSPSGRFHHSMSYDGVSGSVLLFGGYNGRYQADTWAYRPIAACGGSDRVIAYVPGTVSASPTADSALGAPDGVNVDLGIGGRVDLGFDREARNGAGTDLIVYATAASVFGVEASEDGVHFALLRDCFGGACQLDLSEAGLARVSSLRITALSPDVGAEIDAVSVVHGPPPTIVCPASVRVECQAAGLAVVSFPPATAAGSCFGTAAIANDHNAGGADASGSYPLGTTTVTFTATDDAGGAASCVTSITVADTAPPVVTVQASPAFLWPPDHTMRPVHFTVVAVDACDPSPVVLLQSVVSSDPDDAPGLLDGATTGDVQVAAIGAPVFDVLLRAERYGGIRGRTYGARYQATDGSGNAGTGLGTVAVANDLRLRRH